MDDYISIRDYWMNILTKVCKEEHLDYKICAYPSEEDMMRIFMNGISILSWISDDYGLCFSGFDAVHFILLTAPNPENDVRKAIRHEWQCSFHPI